MKKGVLIIWGAVLLLAGVCIGWKIRESRGYRFVSKGAQENVYCFFRERDNSLIVVHDFYHTWGVRKLNHFSESNRISATSYSADAAILGSSNNKIKWFNPTKYDEFLKSTEE